MGMHAEGPLQHRADEPPGEFWLWPEHVQSFGIFRSCVTQWRVGVDGRHGLDYPAVQIVMRQHSGRVSGYRPRDQRRLLAELQVLELGALSAWADERAKKGNPA